MTKDERAAYQREVRAVAKRLGLPARGDHEGHIIRHIMNEVRKFTLAHGQPRDLSDLLEMVATSLNLEIAEILSDNDLGALLERIPPEREPAMARISSELDDQTDAVVLQRQWRDNPADMPYLAIVNCREWHWHKRYFSKWHEVVHLLLDGKQLRFEFRRTPAERKHPEEILVDKIAGEIAFYSEMFEPILSREIARAGMLTFDVVERVRMEIAPHASYHSTLLACVRYCRQPVYVFKIRLGYKKSEERQITDLLAGLDDGAAPMKKLRVREPSASPPVKSLGIRVHDNMEVPDTSIVSSLFENAAQTSDAGLEQLERWRTSGGPVGRGPIHVEAQRVGNQVWCLMTLLSRAWEESLRRVVA